jgi:tetratricopeptide (TPR) repeat protein
MEKPHALVIPFGVPERGKGLGLGLASLVHSFARIDDGDVALAQIRSHGSDGGVTGIVEAFVTAAQWRAMPGSEDTPPQVRVVLTGAFEPPRDGRGAFSVLAFDAKTGELRAKLDAVLDADGAGRSIADTLESVCARVGGDASGLRGLESLSWDALESVLMAETWRVRALSGTEPSGVVAALAHLGRAVSEARDATFPAERLATMAFEIARTTADVRNVEAALRTVTTATVDTAQSGFGSAALEAAAGGLALRLGRVDEAVAHAERAIEHDAARALPHALMAEAKRVRGDLAGARRAIEVASAIDERDPYVCNERAVLAVLAGDAVGAQAEWQRLLSSNVTHVAAFANLTALALERGDSTLAQLVVDHALSIRGNAPLDMLRRAVQVALAVEPVSVARGSRIASLCRAVIEREPKDVVAALLLVRALSEMGERETALERLVALETTAKGTLVAAEALRVRLHVEEPLAATSIDAAMRAAQTEADGADFEAIATRARRLAEDHDSWVGFLAAGIAERRTRRLGRARVDTMRALAIAPSAPLAHLEMALLLLASKDAREAVTHARRAIELDPSSARAREVLVEAEREAEAKKRASWIDKLLKR